MEREERAKQFAPFESLNGLRRALAKKEEEHERIERAELSEEKARQLDCMLGKLSRGMTVNATYYSGGFYIDVTGRVTDLDIIRRFVKIGNGKIFFDDLYGLEIISER